VNYQQTITSGVVFFTLTLFFLTVVDRPSAGELSQDKIETKADKLLKKAEEGKTGKLTGTHYYWKDGFHIENRKAKVKIKIGAITRRGVFLPV